MRKTIKAVLKPAYHFARDLLAEPRNPLLRSVVCDELMWWMRFINPGMLIPENIELFAYCVEHLPSDAAIVEIGSFAGLSLNHIIHFLRRSDRHNLVFSVDEWKFEEFRGRAV